MVEAAPRMDEERALEGPKSLSGPRKLPARFAVKRTGTA